MRITDILDYLFPSFCRGCGKTQDGGAVICPPCYTALPRMPHHARCAKTTIFSAAPHDGLVRTLVHTLKFDRIQEAAEPLADLLYETAGPLLASIPSPLFIPLPLHPSREVERGFNQSECIARILSKKTNIALRTDLLQRVRSTAPQTELLHRNERLQNVRTCFAGNGYLGPATGIVIDDVITSGATLADAIRALRTAGMTRVFGMTVAYRKMVQYTYARTCDVDSSRV